MVKTNYTFEGIDPEHTAKALGRNLDLSRKHCVEICREIQGMKVEGAKKFLDDVMEKNTHVPFRRFFLETGHRKGKGWKHGRYPFKASKKIKEIISHAEANADYKGLDIESLKIISAISSQGDSRFRRQPNGKWRGQTRQYTNVELVVGE